LYTPYAVTPTLSDDAPHDNDTDVSDTPVTFRPVGVEGAVVSPGAGGHAAVDALRTALPDLFPAASAASTDRL
jgi:hypothetical protein